MKEEKEFKNVVFLKSTKKQISVIDDYPYIKKDVEHKIKKFQNS
jgi:hypothetical protein